MYGGSGTPHHPTPPDARQDDAYVLEGHLLRPSLEGEHRRDARIDQAARLDLLDDGMTRAFVRIRVLAT